MDPGGGDSVSLARSISKDSLASSIVHLTPQNQPQPAALRTDGRSLLSNVDIEDEDEELLAIVRTDMARQGGDPGPMAGARSPQRLADTFESKPDSFFLEPLMPAVLRPAKEKQVVTKEDVYKLDARVENTRNFSRHGRVPQGGHNHPQVRTLALNPSLLFPFILYFVCLFSLAKILWH